MPLFIACILERKRKRALGKFKRQKTRALGDFIASCFESSGALPKRVACALSSSLQCTVCSQRRCILLESSSTSVLQDLVVIPGAIKLSPLNFRTLPYLEIFFPLLWFPTLFLRSSCYIGNKFFFLKNSL